MTKLITALFAVAFMCGVNASSAQNVKSDQDKAQGQEQKMQEKEKGATTGAGQQGAPSDRERARSDETRSAPTGADAAKDCKGMTGRAKEQCMKKNAPATGQTDTGTTGQKQKQQ